MNENSYQNITISLIITVGMCTGAGVVPTLLGVFGDYGLGWLGFVLLGGFMIISVMALLALPEFGKE